MSESQCDHIARDMGRILLMVAQGTDRVFGSGCSMRVGCGANGRIAFRRKLQAQEPVFSQPQIVESGQFHEKVVRMLSIGNRRPIICFALLEKQGVTSARHGRRLKAEHYTNC